MLDIEQHQQLEGFLAASGLLPADAEPRFENLAGGVSNRTVLVRSLAGNWVVKQALEKLRVAVDWHADPERIHREAAGLRWLARLTEPGSIPAFVFEDHRHHILVMEAVPEPHVNYKTLLLEKPPDSRLIAAFAALLAAIHSNAGSYRETLRERFGDRRFFETLRLDPYYGHSARQLPHAAPFLEKLIDRTRDRSLTLVHGDYSPKNVLVRQERLVLLDHEVIHFGDPGFDVGFALAHLLSKAHYLRQRRALLLESATRFWQSYHTAVRRQTWADDLETACILHTLGCLLARTAGKSPLEYLDQRRRKNQQEVVLSLLHHPPVKMTTLIHQFEEHLSAYETD